MHEVRLCLKLLTESKRCREHGTLILIVRFAFRERKRGRGRGDGEINRWIDRPIKRF